jgi:hypothetical protein
MIPVVQVIVKLLRGITCFHELTAQIFAEGYIPIQPVVKEGALQHIHVSVCIIPHHYLSGKRCVLPWWITWILLICIDTFGPFLAQ